MTVFMACPNMICPDQYAILPPGTEGYSGAGAHSCFDTLSMRRKGLIQFNNLIRSLSKDERPAR